MSAHALADVEEPARSSVGMSSRGAWVGLSAMSPPMDGPAEAEIGGTWASLYLYSSVVDINARRAPICSG